jgi:hypothetical protein
MKRGTRRFLAFRSGHRRDKQECAREGIPNWLRRYGRQHAGGVIYSSMLLMRMENRQRHPPKFAPMPMKVRAYREDIGGEGWVKT